MSKSILISIIGDETIPNFRAYKEFKPDVLIHLFSSKTKNANAILASLIDPAVTSFKEIEVDGFDFKKITQKLEVFDLELEKTDFLTLNLTGGTKMMALALMDFARKQEEKCTVSYFYIDTDQNIQWFKEDRIETFCNTVDLKEFIELKGQKIHGYSKYADMMLRFKSELPAFAKLLVNPNDKNYQQLIKLLDKVRKLTETSKRSNLDALNEVIRDNRTNNFYQYCYLNGQFDLTINDFQLQLFVQEKDLDYFLFNTGWFELLCASKIAKNFNHYFIYLNVEFPILQNLNQGNGILCIKNEVDVLLNDGGKLIFIECKAGRVSSSDIDKIIVRRDTYGGLVAEARLVYLFDSGLPAIVREKCEENKIAIQLYKNL